MQVSFRIAGRTGTGPCLGHFAVLLPLLVFASASVINAQDSPVAGVTVSFEDDDGERVAAASDDSDAGDDWSDSAVITGPGVPQVRQAFRNSTPWFGYTTPVRVGAWGGENFAEPGDFLSLDILHPYQNFRYGDGSEEIRYVDGRFGINSEGGGTLNLGFGSRAYFADTDTIADVNIWYDGDTTRDTKFQQFTAGGQLQSEDMLLRGHYYHPFGDTRKFAGYTPLTGNAGYAGNTLALERFRRVAEAYRGFDAEIGFLLNSDTPVQLLGGYYHFVADNAADVSGFTATLQAEILPRLNVAVQGTFDDNDDTNVLVSAVYEFSSRPSGRRRTMRDRLGDAARRNRHIVSRETLVYDPLSATSSGSVINVIHAASGGAGGGTFESPHSSLAAAAADAGATPDSIILAHADSVFDGQGIVVPSDTRFLGEVATHLITTDQLGEIMLPRATAGTSLPTIRNAPAAAAAITLADNVEVNGFLVDAAGGTGVFGDGLTTGVTLKNTVIDGAATGIHLLNTGGTLSLDPIVVSNTTGAGLLIQDTAATGSLTFDDVTITVAGTNGVEVSGSAAGSSIQFDGDIDVTNSGAHGIALTGNADESSQVFNGATTITTTGGSGIFVSNAEATPVGFDDDIEFVGAVAISDTTGSAVHSLNNGSNIGFSTLSIEDWQGIGIELDSSNGNFSVSQPMTLDNAIGSLASTISLTGTLGDVAFGDVTIVDTVAGGGDPTIQSIESDTGVDQVTFASLNVTTVGRTALFGSETGTNFTKLVIGGGTITTDGATAIDLDGLATDVTFDAVNVSNTGTGIRLTNVGTRTAFHDQFVISGDGATAGSGGSFTNVGTGVSIAGSTDVSLQFMNIDSTIAGISASHVAFNQSERLTINGLDLTDAGGTANWVGIDIVWDRGAHFADQNFITNNTITGTGGSQTGLRITNNQSNPEMFVTIESNGISLTGAGTTGVSLSATGILPGQTTNLGGISLTGTVDNTVTAGSTLDTSESVGATIDGTIRLNGVDVP